MVDAFVRMHRRLFARLGQEALLRGLPTSVIIDNAAQVYGEYGQATGYRTVATLPIDPLPRVGDALIVAGNTRVIDSIDVNDGYIVKAVLRE